MKPFIFSVITIMLLLNACSLERKLIGAWRIADASFRNISLKEEKEMAENMVRKVKKDGYAKFNADGTGNMKIAGVLGDVKWFISKDKKLIYTINAANDTTKNEIIAFTDRLLKIKSGSPLGDFIITFQKEE